MVSKSTGCEFESHEEHLEAEKIYVVLCTGWVPPNGED